MRIWNSQPRSPIDMYRTIELEAKKFESKTAELDEEIAKLNAKTLQLKLAENPPTDKEIESCNVMSKKLRQLVLAQQSIANQAKTVKEEADAKGAKLNAAILAETTKQSVGLDPARKALVASRIRVQMMREFSAAKTKADLQVTRLTQLMAQLNSHETELNERIKSIVDRKNAQESSIKFAPSAPILERRKKEILDQAKKHAANRAAFEQEAGPGGADAKHAFLNDLSGHITNAVRDRGFVDIAGIVEKSMKSIPTQYHHTEFTFLQQIVGRNIAMINFSISPWIAVYSQIRDGDTSPDLIEQCTKVVDAIKTLVNSDVTAAQAAHWWKTAALAKPHIDALSALLESSLKYRIIRYLKEDIAEWTRTLRVAR